MMKYDPEWSVEVLKDLSAFFRANEMYISSEKTDALVAIVTIERAHMLRGTEFDGSGYSDCLKKETFAPIDGTAGEVP